MQRISQANWTPIEEYGAYYAVKDGVLLQAAMHSDGSFDPQEACQATAFDSANDETTILKKLLGITR